MKTNCRASRISVTLLSTAFVAPLLVGGLAAVFTSPACGQTAYFSVTGEFNTAGDELDFGFNLSRPVTSGEALGFATYASSGGVNEAGDTIADGPGDSELMLFNAGGTLIAEDDDQAVLSRDSLITFTEGDTPLPSPMTAQVYRLNLSDFDDDADPFAVDLVGPADAFRFSGFTTAGTGNATVTSLKFGTVGTGSEDALFFATSSSLVIDGPLVIGQTGNATFLQLVGTTTVTGTTTVNPGDTLNVQAIATFNADGDITVNGGTLLNFGTGLNLLASGKNLLATNGGQVQTTSNFLFLDSAQTATINSGADWTHTGTLIAGSNNGNGTITVDGSGSTLNVSGTLDLTSGGNRGVVNVKNNAQATSGVLDVGRSNTTATTDAMLNINNGGGLTTGDVRVGDANGNQGTGTINLAGSGSTLTQTGTSVLTLGNADTPGNEGVHTLNVTDNAVFNTGTGLTTIRKTGTLNVNTGGTFSANGDITVDGSTFNHLNTGLNLLAQGRNLLVTNDGLLQTTGSRLFFDGQRNATLNGGADWTHTGELIAGSVLGSGSITVDGIGSTLVVNGDISVDTDGTLTVRNSGNLDANGNINVVGGSFINTNTGQNLLASGKNLLATNGGQVQTTSNNLFIDLAQTATINSGADWIHTGDLIAGSNDGNGTITVDGSGSTLNVTGILALTNGGNRGVVNVQNNAQATSGQLEVGRSSSTLTTDAELNINTGGDLATGNVLVGEFDGNEGTGTINLAGSGSTLTQTGASVLFLGNANNANNVAVHAINVTDNAVFTTGSGTTTIRKTGTLNINTGGVFNANGNINVIGGTINALGGSFTVGGDLVVDSNGELNLLGSGFTLDGTPITGLSTSTPTAITDRDATLAGLFVDGLPFSFDLNATTGLGDFFATDALLTLLLTEETALAGDFDFDGDVDGADFLVWQRGGSPNGINSGDLAAWQNNYGAGSTGLQAATAVPEPTSLLLLLFSLPFTCRRR